MKRSVMAVCALLLAFPLLCSCSGRDESGGTDSAEAAAKAEVSVGTDDVLDLCIYSTDTLNPLKTAVKHNAEVLSLMYDSLFTVSSDFSAVPDVCESYSLSADGLTFTAQIKNGITFQNGAPLTPADVAASISAILSSDGYYKSRLSTVKSATAKGSSVEIRLKAPTANLNVLLDFPILPEGGSGEAYAKGDILSAVIPGSGLYQLKEYATNKEIQLEVNRSHHSGVMPYIQNITVHMAPDRETAVAMLENSRIDMLTGYAADIDNYTFRKNLNYQAYNGCRFVFLGMNDDDTETNTPKVRSAISAAINREDILSSGNINGVISSVPVHPGASLYSAETDLYGINQPGAGGLLAAEGWADSDSNGVLDKTVQKKTYELSFELLTNADKPTKTLIAESIRKSLSSIGVNVKIRSVPFETYSSKIAEGDYDLFIGETELLPNFDFADILSITNYRKDDALQEAVKSVKLTDDAEVQRRNYSELLSLYCAARPAAGLYFKNELLIFDGTINASGISTLNPYKSAGHWSFSE